MKKSFSDVSLTLLIVLGCAQFLPACGDKFLVYNRGTRFQRAPGAREHASILIYTNPASEASRQLVSAPADVTLQKAGYRPTTVRTAVEFEKALKQGGWDLVLVGLSDAQAVSQRVQGASCVVPVVLDRDTAEVKQARKLYPVILRAPARAQALLATIDEALSYRSRGARRNA